MSHKKKRIKKKVRGRPVGGNCVIPAGYITRREYAELIGRSYDIVTGWEKRGRITPAAYTNRGSVQIPLYTAAQAFEKRQWLAWVSGKAIAR